MRKCAKCETKMRKIAHFGKSFMAKKSCSQLTFIEKLVVQNIPPPLRNRFPAEEGKRAFKRKVSTKQPQRMCLQMF